MEKDLIGMFDSGFGGLTVLKAVQEKLPYEKIIYFADTARLPYGEKSAETVLRYSIENSVFLMDQNIKVLVIACNTAASVSVEKLRKIFNIPVIGVIEPGAEKAIQVSPKGKIAVLATKGTIASQAYQNALKKLLPSVHVVPMACPLLVPLVEEGLITHEATKMILKEYLAPIKQEKVDTLLLGCTHYPLLHTLIREEMGPDVHIVDSAVTCADTLETILKTQKIQSPHQNLASHQYFVSDNPEKFQRLGSHFLGRELPEVFLKSDFFKQ